MRNNVFIDTVQNIFTTHPPDSLLSQAKEGEPVIIDRLFFSNLIERIPRCLRRGRKCI